MGGRPSRESKRQKSRFNPIETHARNICILNACNMYINLYTERSSVAIKPLTIWRKLVMKQLDTIKSLQDKLVALSQEPKVIAYLETKRAIDSLKSTIKKSIIEHMIVRPECFGQRKTFKTFQEVEMYNTDMSKDKRLFQGVIRGVNNEAYIKLSHRSSYEVKPTSILRIDQWRN